MQQQARAEPLPVPDSPVMATVEEKRALVSLVNVHRERARHDPAAFCEYVLRHTETNKRISLSPMQEEWHELITGNDKTLIWAHTEAGKSIDVNARIPTPNGWTTMGNLRVGDTVFDRHGSPCTVLVVSPIRYDRACYRVRFDDGGEIVADAEHLWIAKTFDDKRASEGSNKHSGTGELCECGCGLRARVGKRFIHSHHTRIQRIDGWRTVTTEQILSASLRRVSGSKRENGDNYDRYKWHIPLAEAIQYGPQELPVHPYVLGAWLGDGDKSQALLTFHIDDREVADRCAELDGGKLGKLTPDKRRPHVKRASICASGLKARLKNLGVLGNKHIPQSYLTASVGQRLWLLAGLLDTDGTVGEKGNVCFDNTNETLARGVLQLVRSLGHKSKIRSKTVYSPVDGRDLGLSFTVSFSPTVPVFKLARKLAAQRMGPAFGRSGYRSIVAIERIEPVPVRCIYVDSPDHSYLAGDDYTVTHNTQLLSVGRMLFELGKNPNKRCVVLSNTDAQAKKIILECNKYIVKSEALHEVFPNLRPADNYPWNAHMLYVHRETEAPDPSLQAYGAYGAMLGSRIDLLCLDDILGYKNTASITEMDKLDSWFHSSDVHGRLTWNSKTWIVGNAWDRDDLYHRLAAKKDWCAAAYPVMDELTGELFFPEQWPLKRILKKKEDLHPIEFARQMLCIARSEENSRFKREWIDWCLENGNGRSMALRLDSVPAGYRIISGVDLATGRHKKRGDRTSIVTIAVHPNEHREIIQIESGRWQGPEIVDRIVDTHHRYHSIILVENNAAQEYILQFTRKLSAVPVLPYNTNEKTFTDPDFGIDSMAVEFRGRQWVLPNENGDKAPELDELIRDLLYYDPNFHPGDRLMALFFAREGARITRGKGRIGHLDLVTR